MGNIRTHGLGRRAGLAALVGGIALGSSLVVASPAGADTDGIECGDTITQSIRLREDLVCQDGPALVVENGGGTVRVGQATNQVITGGDGPGIVIESVAGATTIVRLGKISGFDVAVQATGEGAVIVEKVYIDEAEVAIQAEPGIDLTVRDAVVWENGVGVDGADTIERSWIMGNDVGLQVDDGDDLTVRRSVVSGNGVGLDAVQAGTGVGLDLDQAIFVFNTTALRLDPPSGDGEADVSIRRTVFNRSVTPAVQLAPKGTIDLTANVFGANGQFQPPGVPVLEIGGDPSERAGVTLTANGFVLNPGPAIVAPGVTDGGGNIVRRTGANPRCVGIVCGS